ncbi:MAG: BMP family ABC transporter substrate-binding protein [Desulfomicrobium escambiense]|nr:BMP family ABC transporter substrate-binding protein [Desulfomicrobium escambiense]
MSRKQDSTPATRPSWADSATSASSAAWRFRPSSVSVSAMSPAPTTRPDELSVNISFDADHYYYLGSFAPSDEAKNLALGWFNSGVEVIFAAAGGAGSSAMLAAEEVIGKHTIGVDMDQSGQSLTVITSALKGVGEAAFQALTDYYGGTFVGGRTISLGSAEGGVGLPTDFSRFMARAAAVEAAYDSLFDLVVAGTVVVPTNDAASLKAFLLGLGYNVMWLTPSMIDAICEAAEPTAE